jgi:hypothetical protein
MDPDFSLIQARLSHEDDLVNQRVSWLVSSQSFLLTAYAITLNGLAADASKPLAIVQRKLLNLLPIVGAMCVLLVCVALIGGLCAMSVLKLPTRRPPRSGFRSGNTFRFVRCALYCSPPYD